MQAPADLAHLAVVAAAADELPVAIWMGRVPGGEVVYTNAAFREVLGLEPPEGAGRGAFVEPYGVHTASGAPYPEEQMPFERVLAARKTVVLDDLVIHRRDGRRVNLRVFAKPIFDAQGTMTHVLEAFTDISHEVAVERARAEGERRLARSQRLEAIGQLVAGIAHDFNNLLTVTRLSLSTLRSAETDESKVEVLDPRHGLRARRRSAGHPGARSERLSPEAVRRPAAPGGAGERRRRSRKETASPFDLTTYTSGVRPSISIGLLITGIAGITGITAACSSSSDGGSEKPRQCLAAPAAVDLTTPEVSFKTTVAPLIQSKCSLSACHADAQISLGIYLPKDNAQIYKALNAPATSNLKLDFVKTSAPADSYVMHKLDGTHCGLDKDCVKGSCGQEMPPGEPLTVDQRDSIRRWIAQGAKDN